MPVAATDLGQFLPEGIAISPEEAAENTPSSALLLGGLGQTGNSGRSACSMQILVDTKFWNRAFTYMSPKAVLWIRQNKGKAEKHIVLSECVIRLPQDSIEEGFFLNFLCRPAFKTELNRSGTKPQF